MIFHIAGAYGGAERTTVNLATHLEQGVITHITLAANECINEHIETLDNRRIIDLERYRFNGWFRGQLSLLSDIFKVYRLIKRESPDVVLSVMHYASVITAIAALLPGIKVTKISSLRGPAHQHIQNYENGGFRRRFIRFMITTMVRLSDWMLVPSEGTKRDLEQHFHADGARIRVIPNGIDIGRINQQRQATIDEEWIFSDPEYPVICAAARLSREKNIDFLLRVFANLRKRTACRLLVLGDGSERGALEQLAGELGLRESVIFLGHKKNVFPYIDHSKVFLHSCVYEGFGYSIIEAMACGTPVVATDCPYGPREIIGNDRYGLLCPMNDESDMAEKLLLLLTDEKVREQYIELGKGRAGDFSVARMVAGYNQVFASLSAGTNG